MKETTPLANINFSSVSSPNTLTPITKVKQFKPKEDIKEVCTPLEEWALRILSAPEEIQLKELYNKDSETRHCVDKVIDSQIEKPQKMFHITNTPLPCIKHTTDTNTDNEEIDGLNTNTDRNENLSN